MCVIFLASNKKPSVNQLTYFVAIWTFFWWKHDFLLIGRLVISCEISGNPLAGAGQGHDVREEVLCRRACLFIVIEVFIAVCGDRVHVVHVTFSRDQDFPTLLVWDLDDLGWMFRRPFTASIHQKKLSGPTPTSKLKSIQFWELVGLSENLRIIPWFSTGGDFYPPAPVDIRQCLGTNVTNRLAVLLNSNGWKPGMSISILQCTA